MSHPAYCLRTRPGRPLWGQRGRRDHAMTNSPPKRSFVAVFTVVLALFAVGASAATAATIGPLRSGSSSGAENYLYTAGNQVFAPAPGSLSASDAYRYEVIAPDGSVKHTLSSCFSGNAAAGDNYTIGLSDQASGAPATAGR